MKKLIHLDDLIKRCGYFGETWIIFLTREEAVKVIGGGQDAE